MKRIDWLRKINSSFKSEQFSIEDLCEKTKQPRDKVRNAINRNIKTGNIVTNGDGLYRLNGNDSEPEQKNIFEKRLKTLSEKFGDELFTIDDVIKVWNIKRQSIHAAMHKMAKNGIVKRVGKGMYKLTDNGHNFVAEEIKLEPKSKSPSCFILKVESVLGENGMKDWVYRIAMSNEECIKVLEEEAVKALAKTFSLN